MSHQHEGHQHYINLPPLDRDIDAFMRKTNKMVQQVFVNHTTEAGRHGTTNLYMLEMKLGELSWSIQQVIDEEHPAFSSFNPNVMPLYNFKMSLISELYKQMIVVRTNFCNIVFSEN